MLSRRRADECRCEEVQNPEREVPKAMVLSVVAAGITGVMYLIPILFVLPDVDALLAVATGQPIGLVFKEATGSAAGGFGLLFLLLGILFFAGVGSLTAASRCLYAFSRDGAVPGSHMWSKVNHKFDIPLNALLFSTFVQGILGLIYLGSAAAFNAFTGVATICLSASYAMPVFCLVVRGRHLVDGAPFHLGKLGMVVNIITLVWIMLAIVLFCMPTAIPVTASSMNYASVLFVFFSAVALLWYLVWGRRNFEGPAILRAEGGVSTIQNLNTIDGAIEGPGSSDYTAADKLRSRKQKGIMGIDEDQSAGMI